MQLSQQPNNNSNMRTNGSVANFANPANIVNNNNSTIVNNSGNVGAQSQILQSSLFLDEVAKKNLQINLQIDSEVKNKKQLIVFDESQIDNNFKQVEDSLMNLSKVLGSLYLANLSNSTQQQQSLSVRDGILT